MMLISKKSRRKSEKFDSVFREGDPANFPLRQLLRCKEDFSTGLVHGFLLLVFVVVLVMFGRTLNHLFATHGIGLNPAYRLVALGLLGVFILSVLRRLYYKVVELKELRGEISRLGRSLRDDVD